MQTYWIEPKSPLVFRSGRPFGTGLEADTLSFPLPSSIAGALRTAYAEAEQAAAVDYAQRKQELLNISVAGPLLVQNFHGEDSKVLFPRPVDALYLGEDEVKHLVRLQPQTLAEDEGCDLPAGLLPVFADTTLRGKPKPGPDFWRSDVLQKWLIGDVPSGEVDDLGVQALPQERRTHVGLDSKTLAADAGRLFQSVGLDFSSPQQLNGRSEYDDELQERGWYNYEFGLLVKADAKFAPTFRRLGGEGRLARLKPAQAIWPEINQKLAQALSEAKRIRLVLVTPAIFSNGWLPGWLNAQTLKGTPPGLPGINLHLKAMAVERWQAVSGWDLLAGKPRAVRRMTPAGAVYWFEIEQPDSTDVDYTSLWLTSICDNEQDRRDGFGLVVPGIWTD